MKLVVSRETPNKRRERTTISNWSAIAERRIEAERQWAAAKKAANKPLCRETYTVSSARGDGFFSTVVITSYKSRRKWMAFSVEVYQGKTKVVVIDWPSDIKTDRSAPDNLPLWAIADAVCALKRAKHGMEPEKFVAEWRSSTNPVRKERMAELLNYNMLGFLRARREKLHAFIELICAYGLDENGKPMVGAIVERRVRDDR